LSFFENFNLILKINALVLQFANFPVVQLLRYLLGKECVYEAGLSLWE